MYLFVRKSSKMVLGIENVVTLLNSTVQRGLFGSDVFYFGYLKHKTHPIFFKVGSQQQRGLLLG